MVVLLLLFMATQDDFQQFLVSSSEPPKQFSEIPPPLPPTISKTPTGFDPMERIDLEGQAYRGLSGGGAPWWVIITGWCVFGLPLVGMVVLALVTGDFALFAAAPFAMIAFVILARGTKAKLADQREKAARLARRKRAMRE